MLIYPLGAISMLVRWRGTRDMSISLHAASARGAYWLFAGLLTVGGAILSVFVLGWLVPTLQLGQVFSLLFLAAYSCQLVAAWIPDRRGWDTWQGWAHKLAAGAMAVLFLPLSFLIATSPHVSLIARIVALACAIYMICALIISVVLSQKKEQFLIYQVVYVLAFQVIILAAGYLR